MITGIILALILGSAVFSGTIYWSKTDNELVTRFKRQIRYKNVNAREIEHIQRTHEISTQRATILDNERTEFEKRLQEDQIKHQNDLRAWQEEFKEITREEDEARDRAERERKLVAWKKAEEIRLEAFILEQAERNRQDQETARIAEANNFNNQFNGQAVIYGKVIYARVNVRMQPLTSSQVMFQIEPYQRAPILGWVYGEAYNGHNIWYKLAGTNGYAHGSAFEQAKGVLPDLNEYEDTYQMRSMDGTVNRTINGPPKNPWDSHAAPTDTTYQPLGHTGNDYKVFLNELEKSVAVLPISLNEAAVWRHRERARWNADREARKKAITEEFNAISVIDFSRESVDRLNELADEMESLRKEEDSAAYVLLDTIFA